MMRNVFYNNEENLLIFQIMYDERVLTLKIVRKLQNSIGCLMIREIMVIFYF